MPTGRSRCGSVRKPAGAICRHRQDGKAHLGRQAGHCTDHPLQRTFDLRALQGTMRRTAQYRENDNSRPIQTAFCSWALPAWARALLRVTTVREDLGPIQATWNSQPHQPRPANCSHTELITTMAERSTSSPGPCGSQRQPAPAQATLSYPKKPGKVKPATIVFKVQ